MNVNINRVFETALDFELGGVSFSPSYLQAGVIILLLFVLVLTLARLRRLYMDWSLRGAGIMLFFGFLLALILEGFLILGGRTLFTEIIGWKNAPKPLLNVLDVGRAKLVDVLGVTEEIPGSSAKDKPSFYDVVTSYQSLSSEEAEQFRLMICQP
jgi:hypothetical protein